MISGFSYKFICLSFVVVVVRAPFGSPLCYPRLTVVWAVVGCICAVSDRTGPVLHCDWLQLHSVKWDRSYS